MKKGYKKCPFCANEIKSDAIKCQFCEEILVQERKESLKENSFFYKFFRKDLNLSSKRWHRLFKIIWIFTIIIGCIIAFGYISDEYPSYEPYFQFEGYVVDRITTGTVAPADYEFDF